MKKTLPESRTPGKEEVDVSQEQQQDQAEPQDQSDRVEQVQGHAESEDQPDHIEPVQEQASQQDQAEQAKEKEEGEAQAPSPKKRRKKKLVQVSEEDISPRPSFWPVLVALALAVTLFGIITHPIVLVIGAVLIIFAIVGWVLERR